MSPLFSVWQIVVKRSIANWRLLSTVLVGIIVTVAILSSVPLYSNAINDLGLKNSLENRAIELLDLHVYAPNYFIIYDEFMGATDFINQHLTKNLRKLVRQEETWIQTQTFNAFYTDRPTPGGAFQPTGYFHVFSNLDQHINIVDGQLAQPPPSGLTQQEIDAPDFAIEGMIGSETAEIFGVKVGDRLIFRSGSGGEANEITIKLSAIIDPIDPEDEFWSLNTQVFTLPLVDEEGNSIPPRAPIFVPEQTLFNIIPRFFPEARASYNWFFYVDIAKVYSENAETLKNDIRQMEREILVSLPRSGLFTTLDSLITEYQGKLMFTQIPLFLIVFQIAAIILYYLMMVSNMLIEQQSREISIFRSRGAGTWHIFSIYFIEGLSISVIGGAIGLLLGAFLFSLLGRTGSFQSLTGGETIPIRFSGTVLILTISAVVLCLIALLIPAIQASRRGIVHQRQAASRPPAAPLWQRFYLDLILLVLGAVLYWELKERGSLVSMNVFGGLGIDPLLLITPILLFLAVAIIFIRVFPLLIKLATRLSRYLKNTSFVIGLWYMARNPAHYTRLILLLVMTTSVGMFSSTFIGTLDRSYIERSMYMSGGDVRLESLNDSHVSKKSLEDRYTNIEGVENVGIAYRQLGTVDTTFTRTEFEMLAVDPEQMKEIAWFRKDFGAKSLQEIMNTLAEDTPKKEGIDIPDEAQTIGVWVYSRKGNPVTVVYARIKDGKGRYMEVELGTTDPESEGWQFMEGRLTVFGSDEFLPPPLSLSCLYIRTEGSGKTGVIFQELCFDDLQVGGSTFSKPLIIEDFDDVSEWQVSPDEASGASTGTESAVGRIEADIYTVHNGKASGKLRWNTRNTSILGIYPAIDDRPVAVVASQSFLDSTKMAKNDVAHVSISGQYMFITVVEVIDYFPSLDPASMGFIIVNLDRLLNVGNRQLGTSIYPNEVWLTLTDDVELRDTVIDKINGGYLGAKYLYDKDAMISDFKNDPLAGAAWGGILLIAFLGVILVSGLGFIVYSYLSAQRRQLDFAILRSLGFSLQQIIGLVCFEQLFIIAFGMGLGTITGERLNYIMIPFLQLTERGAKVLPPFILTINWETLGIAYSILAVAFIITISLVILFFSRTAINDTLRRAEV
jgi:ABC-type lipoprotein release transport system permease subunit